MTGPSVTPASAAPPPGAPAGPAGPPRAPSPEADVPSPSPGPPRARRGRLTVYLGAAPGVGKTCSMLDEAHRRLARGTDVVVGLVETHGRSGTAALLTGLEVVPPRTLTYRDVAFRELDVDAVLARAPQVAMVDELAHSNVPGSRNPKRWQDVRELLDAGIDVVTTVNVQHLESLTDDVEAITGVRQRETVPDGVVRDAEQIQLVDLSPHALRRRLAHGNVYRPEQIDASLASYFRLGNLTGLRELALLWLADRVDDALTTYRKDHRIDETWPARERVVVAVTGGPEGETLIRRGARIAQRSAGSELLAVHVLASDGLPPAAPQAIAEQRRLTESLGGTFHTVVGEDVATAVVDFARGVNATMIVVGVSRRSRWSEALSESNGVEIARLADTIDVHLVTHERARTRGRRWRGGPLTRRRLVLGSAAAVVVPPSVTAALLAAGEGLSLSTSIVVYLALTVGVALVGGLWPALVSAVASFLLLNYFFTPPTGRLTIDEPQNTLALVVFVVIAAAVASVVDIAARRTSEAFRARAEASALAAVSRSVLRGEDTDEAITVKLRETFALTSVSLLERAGDTWTVLAADGPDAAEVPGDADTVVEVDAQRVLALRGRPLPASDRRVLEAFASQSGAALERRRLHERAERARALEETDAARNALLGAVSHDLRTPLAMIRTAVDGLTAPDVHLDAHDTAALLATIRVSAERLEGLIDNLLDLSRLQAGGIRPALRAVSVDEVVLPALDGVPTERVTIDVDETLPLVQTDPGLLERVVANLVSNAVRHAPPGSPVRVHASADARSVEVRIVDTGPGVAEELKDRMFEPFQRLGRSLPDGVGLGLAVARGLAAAVGAEVVAEDTPGGGLTMVVSIPRAQDGAS
ncbi:DUF4118 domain-containing protein [Actinotalea subterranea]|uniref:DUF4118 domain-containing protein n=1 Tax=Actinotalea subterranea TaxID=2607497 RepID=UPI0011EFFE71|nr:DUF4118 domain-containing protein [Actinotalea subterranea]